jgi:subtilisin family serine protease
MMLRRIAAFLLFSLLPAIAQRIPGEYVLELETPPLAERVRTLDERNTRRAAIQGEQRAMRGRLAAMGADVFTSMETVGNLVAVRWQGDEAALRGLPGVRKVYPAYYLYPLMDQARELHGLPEAWAKAGGIENAGKGIKIAIIDTGIDTTHPAFQDETLEYPEGFPKFRREADEAVVNRKVIVARSYDDFYFIPGMTSARDFEGHGTSVAMAAAGVEVEANYGRISGAAPKAFLGAYRVFPYNGSGASSTAILQAINDAIEDDMDVINLSLGGVAFDRGTDELYSKAARRALENGKVVVAAAGNEGPDAGTVGRPAHLPEVLAVGATAPSRVVRFPVRFQDRQFFGTPGGGPNGFEMIEGQLYDARSGGASGLACEALPSGQLAGKIALIDRGECLFEMKLNFAMQAGARAAVIVNSIAGEPIAMAVGEATLPAIMIRRDDGASLRELLTDAPGETAGILFNGVAIPLNPRQMTGFSSRGPSVAARPKPDIAAVGALVYSATTPGRNANRYSFQNGTSLSSPIVAGALAALRAHRPGLTAQQYRSILTGTATSWGPEDEREFDPMDVGSGLLRLDAALRSSIAASEISLNFGVAQDNAIEARRTLELFNLASEPDTLSVEIHWMSGQMPWTHENTFEVPPGKSRAAEIHLDLHGMEHGVSMGIIVVRSALTGSALRIPYWFANPSREPDRIDDYGAFPRPRPGIATQILFRIFDTTGLPMLTDEITIEPLTEGLTVIELDSDNEDYYSIYGLRVRPVAGVNTVRIHVGEFSHDITFQAN